MFSSPLLFQIRQLVTSLNKKNFNSNKEELKQVRGHWRSIGDHDLGTVMKIR